MQLLRIAQLLFLTQSGRKNSFARFKRPNSKPTSKQGKKIKLLQNNVALFGQLYISMQNLEGYLKEFLPTKYNLFHHHCLTLEKSVCLAPNQTCFHVLCDMLKIAVYLHMALLCLMVGLSITCELQKLFVHKF